MAGATFPTLSPETLLLHLDPSAWPEIAAQFAEAGEPWPPAAVAMDYRWHLAAAEGRGLSYFAARWRWPRSDVQKAIAALAAGEGDEGAGWAEIAAMLVDGGLPWSPAAANADLHWHTDEGRSYPPSYFAARWHWATARAFDALEAHMDIRGHVLPRRVAGVLPVTRPSAEVDASLAADCDASSPGLVDASSAGESDASAGEARRDVERDASSEDLDDANLTWRAADNASDDFPPVAIVGPDGSATCPCCGERLWRVADRFAEDLATAADLVTARVARGWVAADAISDLFRRPEHYARLVGQKTGTRLNERRGQVHRRVHALEASWCGFVHALDERMAGPGDPVNPAPRTLFEDLKAGLKDGIDYAAGRPSGVRVVPPPGTRTPL